MSNDPTRIQTITGRERRRRYSAEQKLVLVEEATQPGMTVLAVVRQRSVSPSLLLKWTQLMSQGGFTHIRAQARPRESAPPATQPLDGTRLLRRLKAQSRTKASPEQDRFS